MTTVSQRIATVLATSAFAIGLAVSPCAFAADSMMHDGMHKGMKKHKDAMHGTMKKGDAMMKKDAEPAQ